MKSNWICLTVAALLLLSLGAGCRTRQEPEAELPPVTVLHFLHYQWEARKPMIDIFEEFMRENPDVRIEYDLTGGDQYEVLLQSRFLTKSNMDIVGVHPGVSVSVEYARSGFLTDLTDMSFMQGVEPKFLDLSEYNGRYYALPIDACYIACLYNKKMFSDLDLASPTTWSEFMAACETLMRAGVTPISFGLKDIWIGQLIAYALAATTVYRDNPDFNKQLHDGTAHFSGAEWTKTMEMYKSLEPYFNEDYESISYEQQISLFAGEETAMLVTGTWTLAMIEESNPSLEYGAFILPGSDNGDNWMSQAVGGMLAISANSKNKEAAERFLSYFMREDVYYKYVSATNNLPVKTSVEIDYSPVLRDVAFSVQGTYRFLNQDWRISSDRFFLSGIKKMFAGQGIADIMAEFDIAWNQIVRKAPEGDEKP